MVRRANDARRIARRRAGDLELCRAWAAATAADEDEDARLLRQELDRRGYTDEGIQRILDQPARAADASAGEDPLAQARARILAARQGLTAVQANPRRIRAADVRWLLREIDLSTSLRSRSAARWPNPAAPAHSSTSSLPSTALTVPASTLPKTRRPDQGPTAPCRHGHGREERNPHGP